MEKGRGGKQEGAQKGDNDDGLGVDDDDNDDAESEVNIVERKID